jgi:hypothetical protein
VHAFVHVPPPSASSWGFCEGGHVGLEMNHARIRARSSTFSKFTGLCRWPGRELGGVDAGLKSGRLVGHSPQCNPGKQTVYLLYHLCADLTLLQFFFYSSLQLYTKRTMDSIFFTITWSLFVR